MAIKLHFKGVTKEIVASKITISKTRESESIELNIIIYLSNEGELSPDRDSTPS